MSGHAVLTIVTDLINPVTGKPIISEDQLVDILNNYSTIKNWVYIVHNKDTYKQYQIEEERKKYQAASDEERKIMIIHKLGDRVAPHFHIVLYLSLIHI